MYWRTIISGTVALLLLSGSMALSQDNNLPGVFGSTSEEIRVAQMSDPRVTALEERIRQMTGTIEELNFQILQMQEQLRKMQEDNEYRFQQLEEKKSGSLDSDASRTVATSQPSSPALSSTDVPEDAQTTATPGATQPGKGNPPRNMGTIVFDAQGNVRGGSIGDQVSEDDSVSGPELNSQPPGSNENITALPATDDPDELYNNAYEFILSGDYKTAEIGFRDHIMRFPADPKTPDARFWLGESLLGQQKYRDAAEIFLAASKEYPDSRKAPEMLLKLGVSLSGLKQLDVACATFSEIGKRYPQASAQLLERVKKERVSTGC